MPNALGKTAFYRIDGSVGIRNNGSIPNVTAQWSLTGTPLLAATSVSGALTAEHSYTSAPTSGGSNKGYQILNFNASKSSSLYTTTTSVIPSYFSIKFYVKY